MNFIAAKQSEIWHSAISANFAVEVVMPDVCADSTTQFSEKTTVALLQLRSDAKVAVFDFGNTVHI